jgi:hypothetical protein
MTFFLPLTFRQNVYLLGQQLQEQMQVLGATFFLLVFFAGAFLSAMFLY